MPSFLERLGRGLTAGSRTAERSLIPALREQGRIEHEHEERDFRRGLLQAAEDRAQDIHDLKLADAERLDKARKKPFFGKLLQLSEAGVDTKSFFPAQSIQDVETAEGLGLPGGTSVKRIMGFQSLENAERAAATEDRQSILNQRRAATAFTTEKTRLLGASQGLPASVLGGAARQYFAIEGVNEESIEGFEELFGLGQQPRAVNPLDTLVQRSEQPLFQTVNPPKRLTAEEIQRHRTALNKEFGEQVVREFAEEFGAEFDALSLEDKKAAIRGKLLFK